MKTFWENIFVILKTSQKTALFQWNTLMSTKPPWKKNAVRKQPFSLSFFIHVLSIVPAARLTSQRSKSFWLRQSALRKFLHHKVGQLTKPQPQLFDCELTFWSCSWLLCCFSLSCLKGTKAEWCHLYPHLTLTYQYSHSLSSLKQPRSWKALLMTSWY